MFLVLGEESGAQPITNIEPVSIAQFGGKAHRCYQLSVNNFSVPQSLVLPVSIYERHIQRLGLLELICSVLKNSDCPSVFTTLKTIRQRIQNSHLEENILTGIWEFASLLNAGVTVRSSALSEDTNSRTAAGQYITVLNCRDIGEIECGVLECWSSLWTPHTFRAYMGTTTGSCNPQMAVMIMEMVDATASGVLFTKNPITGANETVIEAVWGLGEGLVSKGLTPDRLIFDSQMSKLDAEIAYKPAQYRMTEDENRAARISVPLENRARPALSDEQAIGLFTAAKKIENLFSKAQNIEWAVDSSGTVWILQSRDITSKTIPLPTFVSPGIGEWKIIDHIAHPGTRCFAEYYYAPMENGWNEEALDIGMLNRVKIREVNGFMYHQMGMVESEEESYKMCQTNEGYWEQKRYLAKLHQWDKSVKTFAIKQLTALQNIRLDELSDEKLIEHLEHCLAITRQMVKMHHLFTYTSFIPVGDFIKQVCGWTNKKPVDVLDALRGSVPNRLFIAHEYPAVAELLNSLQKNTTALYLLSKVDREPETASQVLNQLLTLDENIERGLQFMLDHFGYRIVNGYDIAVETFIERPDLLLKSVKSILNHRIYSADHGHKKGILAIRDLVANEKKSLFDEMLHDARQMERLRDERGINSDLWAIGIFRHAFLEAGRRLAKEGIINSPELVLDASIRELIDLLQGNPAVSVEELERRAQYRLYYSIKDAPAVLGESPTEPLDLSNLPPSMARTMAGLMTAFTLAVEHVRHEAEQRDKLVGVPASRGVVEGIARVISSDAQINEINRGDILVVYQTTAAFNTVFPLIGGIIAQYGGVLSHPAILAREYEIPCLVGCSGAMEYISTGMRICLDGSKGEVKIISEDDYIAQRLESLQCEYYGPMQGRNRSRVYNHINAVSARLGIIEEIRKSESCLEILSKHFNNEVCTVEAADRIIKQTQIGITRKQLESFTRRYHVEFHPCDVCNLRCSGCTYFHDLSSKTDAFSFPFEQMGRICSVIQPRAITIVGGGEPSLYKSEGQKLGDLIYALGNGEFGNTPEIGVITNGTLLPPGNSQWHHYVKWIRYSLDASSEESYKRGKGRNYFDKVVDNILRILAETDISHVGIGFLYHPGNIAEAGPLISRLADRVRQSCPGQLHRFNIQFRPWRMPTGSPSINERILSQQDIEEASAILFSCIEQDNSLVQFIRQNTNIAVNLLCGGAREEVDPFSECYFGLAKTVVRANGDLYPCFRMAAAEDSEFYCGNIIADTPLKIALKELYVSIFSAKKICVPDYKKCLLCIFNNILEKTITYKSFTRRLFAEDYFF